MATMKRLGIVFVLLAFWTSRLPAAADSAYPPPIVVVYPFTVSGNTTDPRSGGNVALLLSTRLEQLGGVTVKPFTPGTSRADFLTAAKTQSADYYVTGFITPIGSEVSLITQVVSTYGGTVVWSNTVTIRTYADALGQADGLRSAIIAHAERGIASLGSEPVPATSAAPSRDAADVNLTKALGRHHRVTAASATPTPAAAPTAVRSAAASAAPSPVPSPAAVALGDRAKDGPSKARKVLVTDVGGSADATLRMHASNALAAAFLESGLGGGYLSVTGQDAVVNAARLCQANAGSSALYVGMLTVSDGKTQSIALDVTAYDCTGKTIETRRDVEAWSRRVSLSKAIDVAAKKLATAFILGK